MCLFFLLFFCAEYGRTCKDIGCLPSETCVITQDSCSWGQQDGKECGNFPTCKKSSTMNGNSSPGKQHFNITLSMRNLTISNCVRLLCISLGIKSFARYILVLIHPNTHKNTHTTNTIIARHVTQQSKLDCTVSHVVWHTQN